MLWVTGVQRCALPSTSAYASGPDKYLQKVLATDRKYQNNPAVKMMLAPHAPYTVSDDLFSRIAALSSEQQHGIHIHFHVTAFEEIGRAPGRARTLLGT